MLPSVLPAARRATDVDTKDSVEDGAGGQHELCRGRQGIASARQVQERLRHGRLRQHSDVEDCCRRRLAHRLHVQFFLHVQTIDSFICELIT